MTTVGEAFRTAVALHEAGRLTEAEAWYKRILVVAPDYAECRHRLGAVALQTGRPEQAVALVNQAIACDDREPVYFNTLGNAWLAWGRLDQAAASYRQALELKPDYAGARHNLGNVLQAQGRSAAAVVAFERVLAIWPDHAETLNNLGAALLDLGRFDEAVARVRQALAIKPDLVEALNTLGKGLQELGQLDQAVTEYRRALRHQPECTEAHSNLLMTLNYLPEFPAARLTAEHRAFGVRLDRMARGAKLPHRQSRDPERRLKIGYVSGDFRDHVVGHFVLPLLEAHDRSQVVLYGYSNTARPDAITVTLRAQMAVWRETVGIDTEALAAQIHADEIDILVDLAGHSAFNRLPVFARKPAPLQMTWLGYPATTGLSAMDYRLVDIVTDPVGSADPLSCEALIRLGPSFLCYRASQTPDVKPPPVLRQGFITFGSFNNLNKINTKVIEQWAALLHRLPSARLLVKSRQLSCPSVQHALWAAFAGHGIGAERIVSQGWMADTASHLETYHHMDIALDPFPYNGTTTTCEALWMGVPVVTVRGDRHAARVGASLLESLGLGALVAESPAASLEIAAALALNPERLTSLRAELRDRVAAAPLSDAPGLARRVESAYRQAWRRWCRGETPEPFTVAIP
jgi:predicted O-linked N-acetylglucosamine transferase (SPINDLY family)